MNYLWPAILQLLAFAVLFAEILVPSFGTLTLVALGLGVWSWAYIVAELPRAGVIAFAAADAVLVPLAVRQAFRFLGRSPVSHRTDVGAGSGLEEATRALQPRVGREAVAETPLRPAGKVRLDDEVLEAEASGEFIEAGARVRLVGVRGTIFLVERSRAEGWRTPSDTDD
jgi:membrane-bound serine protease (ClpP class)